jgi:transcriptional regulator with XRE-family HTH domain
MKLKALLNRHGVTQTELARLLGRDKSVVTNLLQGRRQLKADEAGIISKKLGVPVAEILGLQESATGVAEACLIPFQHAPTKAKKARQVVQKGGKYFLEESAGFSGKAYALEVRDDALNLSGVLPGDIVISELDRPCKPGQIVAAQHYAGGGAATIIRRYDPPFLVAHSTNPAHRTLHVERDDVRLVSPVLKLVRLL